MNPFVKIGEGIRNINLISDAVLEDGFIHIIMSSGGKHKTEFTSYDEFQIFFNGALNVFMTQAANVGIEVSKSALKDLEDWGV